MAFVCMRAKSGSMHMFQKLVFLLSLKYWIVTCEMTQTKDIFNLALVMICCENVIT